MVFYPEHFRPFTYKFGLPVISQEATVSAIPALLRPCSPDAVVRGISKVIVFSINLMIRRWTRPHVGIEFLKTIEPPVTYGDSPSSVIPVGGKIGPRAAGNHIPPDSIFRGLTKAMIRAGTTATSGISISKIRALRGADVSAITATEPSHCSPSRTTRLDSHKHSKSMAGHIDVSRFTGTHSYFSPFGRLGQTVACSRSLLIDIGLPHQPQGINTGGRPPGCLAFFAMLLVYDRI